MNFKDAIQLIPEFIEMTKMFLPSISESPFERTFARIDKFKENHGLRATLGQAEAILVQDQIIAKLYKRSRTQQRFHPDKDDFNRTFIVCGCFKQLMPEWEKNFQMLWSFFKNHEDYKQFTFINEREDGWTVRIFQFDPQETRHLLFCRCGGLEGFVKRGFKMKSACSCH